MSQSALITVQEHERKKMYRLNRRVDGLKELLEMLNNTKIELERNSASMKVLIETDMKTCQARIQKWWNIIGKKYGLPTDKKFNFIYDTGEIFLA